MKLAVAGQRTFGRAVAEALARDGHEIAAVVAPLHQRGREDPLHHWAWQHGVPSVVDDGPVAELLPAVDVLVAAHSHRILSRRARGRARLAAIGYHPSLLPLHRGRDAVRWTVRDGDRVTGGTVYHLTDSVDGGPIAAQQHVLIPPGYDASRLWSELLFPLGVALLREVVEDLALGNYIARPQDERCATWEPSWERAPLHRPDLPELEAAR